ncbi:cytochrome p450 domain-containing protein [Phthorimaea operculella]|nr:cytochrome p450 domain-containing protein [Phthorimaea operculella]
MLKAHIWKRSIKKLAGTFTGSIVEGYQEVFNAQAQRLVDKLKVEVGREPFDVMNKYLAYTTLETICQTALGVPRISDSVVTHEYYKAFNKTFELFITRGMNILLHLDWVYRLTPGYKELMKNVAVLHNVSETVIKKRMKEREEMKRNGTLPLPSSETGKSKFLSFLDILFDLREADPTLSMEQIRNEVDTIIVGGQETVATTLFMTLLVIGSKLDIQEKLYAEMKDIFGDSKRPVEKEDLARMVYTDAVINETLRVYPPIPMVMREADRDLQIKSCTIPKGTACGVNAWGAGKSKRIWGPDAEEYKPQRWLDHEDLGRTKSTSFLAFSYGKRACIGRRYANALLKTMLAYIIRDLKVHSTLEELQFKIDVTLKADGGHFITLESRDSKDK